MPDLYLKSDPIAQMLPLSYSEAISLASDWTSADPWTCVMAVGAGIIKGRLAGDTADRDLPIGAYDLKPYRLILVRGTANGTTATGLVRGRS